MTYRLELTSDERAAMDWIGDRYFHGQEMYELIFDADYISPRGEQEWDGDGKMCFDLPEHVAWEVRDGIEGENYELACLASELKNKLMNFCAKIV